MVNIYLDEQNTTSTSLTSIFNLSKPLEYLNFSNHGTIKLPIKTPQEINFTFLEPFDSFHAANQPKLKHKISNGAIGEDICGGGGKLVSKSNGALRQQPYTLNKPPVIPVNLVNNVESNKLEQPMPNAILARLTSISSTLKSIFVRPKNAKHVNLESLNNKHNSHDKSASSQSMSTTQTNSNPFKLNLFSINDHSHDSLYNKTNSHNNMDEFTNNNLNSKLEKIISRNVQKESYKSHLIKIENQLNDTDEEKCLPSSSSSSTSSSSSSSSSSSVISSLSTTSNLTTASSTTTNGIGRKLLTSEAHHRATLYSSNTGNNNNNNRKNTNTSVTTTSNNSKSQTNPLNTKWTCLICLSMHKLDVNICSICGSLQQPSTSTTLSSRSTNFNSLVKTNNSRKINGFDLSTNNSIQQNEQEAESTLLKTINTNKSSYLSKTWTCIHCSFANDCLKIVCMNCRSSKLQQHLEQENNSGKLNLTNHALQVKRKNTNNNNSSLKPKTKLNNSNEENELNNQQDNDDRTASKKARCENCCANCSKDKVSNDQQPRNQNIIAEKSPTKTTPKEQTNQQVKNQLTNFSDDSNKPDVLVTPIKPLGYDKIDALLDANITKPIVATETVKTPLKILATSKWTCSTCLVQNDETKVNCACCSTAKPNDKKTSFDQVDTSSKLSIFSSTSNAKWTCSTCLVANDSQKDVCACCMTKKSGQDASSEQETAKTKFSSLVAAAGSLSNFNSAPLNTSISFGLKPGTTTTSTNEPLKFEFGKSNISSTLTNFSLPVAPVTTPQVTFNTENKTSLFPTSTSTSATTIPSIDTSIETNKPIQFGFLGNNSTSTTTTSLAPVAVTSSTASNPLGFSSFTNNSNISDTPKFGFGSSSTNSSTHPIEGTTSFFGNGFKQESSVTSTNPTQNQFQFGSNNSNFNTTSSNNAQNISNPFVTSAETKKIDTLGNSALSNTISSSSGPNLFQFGFSKTSNQIATTPAPSTSSLAPSLFGNSNSNGFSFGSSTAVHKDPVVTSQPQTNNSLFGAGFGSSTSNTAAIKAETANSTLTPFTFGSSTTNSNTNAASTTNSSSNNVFGSLLTSAKTANQPVPASPFTFGASSATATTTSSSSTTSASTPFVFGATQTTNNASNPNTTSGFNFGNQPSTPRSTTIAQPSTPFVFSGINNGQLNNSITDSPSLQQVLSGNTTPSSRVIKKPVRRFQKK